MSEVRILPSTLSGRLSVPLSKSAAHRAVICSALAGEEELLPPGETLSDDIIATQSAVAQLLSSHGEPVTLDCAESGSTLRFLIPLAAALGIPATFTGRGRLPERPIGVYLDCLPRHGVRCETEGGLPLTISGTLTPGVFSLPGNVSSQFITGLLLALPLLGGTSEITLTSPLESAAYVDMTVQIMSSFGVSVERTETGWKIDGNRKYVPNPDFTIERDWSQAAFFLAAGMFGGPVELSGLNPTSCQGDRAAEELFRRMGAQIVWDNGILTAKPGKPEDSGFEINASQIPDLVPILAAAAALLPGRQTVITHAERLRLKESDRLSAMANGLNRLGANVRELPGGLEITGVEQLHGGKAEGCNDHRVVMALAVAALKSNGETVLTDAQSIRKSYPDFFRDYTRLGGKAYDMG
ncbi:MAG TPA: 3-phosphoshikimate 1-carboxyvinyltransferase [Caproicibacter sp.]|nr:3-phosphoshikimate 1-carboxyvinyltransferase [Caproicibacter sp.]